MRPVIATLEPVTAPRPGPEHRACPFQGDDGMGQGTKSFKVCWKNTQESPKPGWVEARAKKASKSYVQAKGIQRKVQGRERKACAASGRRESLAPVGASVLVTGAMREGWVRDGCEGSTGSRPCSSLFYLEDRHTYFISRVNLKEKI